MKLKKLLIVLLLMIIPIWIYAQSESNDEDSSSCNFDQVTIQSVQLDEKSQSVTEVAQPTIEDKTIDLNLKMGNVGDTAKYNIVIKNDSATDYTFGTPTSTSRYITYSSDTQNNIVPAGTTKTVSLIVKYQNEVPESAFSGGTFVENEDLQLVLSNDSSTPDFPNQNTNTDIKDPVTNPKTGADATLLFIIVTLFAGGILYIVFNKSKTIKHLVIIIGMLLIVPLGIDAAIKVCMCTINVESKITIEHTAAPPATTNPVETIKNTVVTSGDGLYRDSLTANRFVYKGQNPPNHIEINGEDLRILAVEPDNTLKLIKADSIATIPFDPGYANEITGVTSQNSLPGTRYGASGDLCYVSTSNSYKGCKAWGSSSSTLKNVNGSLSNISTFPKINNSDPFNLPADDAYINVYLNGGTYKGAAIAGYYQSLNSELKGLIVDHTFAIGSIGHEENQNINVDINQEQEYLWRGKIGLMSVTDYVLANHNSACSSVYNYTSDQTCYNSTHSNYLTPSSGKEWTITPISVSNIARVWTVDSNDKLDDTAVASDLNVVRPVFYVNLGSNPLSGNGTTANPYIIAK